MVALVTCTTISVPTGYFSGMSLTVIFGAPFPSGACFRFSRTISTVESFAAGSMSQ